MATPTDTERRRIPLLGVVAAVLVIAAVVTWALGGFADARGRLVALPAGTTVSMGPMDMAVTSAVARRPSSSQEWTVEVLGQCRNVTDQAIDGNAGRLSTNAFGLQDPTTGRVNSRALLRFGGLTWADSSDVLNPGLPATSCVLAFDTSGLEPADYVWVGISEVEYKDVSLTGTGDLAWSATRVGYKFAVPLVVDATP